MMLLGASPLLHIDPMLSYAVIGFGAAAYSPAKYGIVTELLPPDKLVAANGWIETLTVASILLGTLGGRRAGRRRTSPDPAGAIALPGGLHPSAQPGRHRDHLSRLRRRRGDQPAHPGYRRALSAAGTHRPAPAGRASSSACSTLWRDQLGQISLAVTTLFWGAGATLQLLVIAWSQQVAGPGAVQGRGPAVGDRDRRGGRRDRRGAARFAAPSFSVLPFGIAMGLVVVPSRCWTCARCSAGRPDHLGTVLVGWSTLVAAALMMLVGALAGYFIVPMNALLQHRGYVLLSAGNSIAVQNFNENLGILVMLGAYTLLILTRRCRSRTTMIAFGLFVAGAMALVIWRHRGNQRAFDAVALIGDTHHGDMPAIRHDAGSAAA